MKFVKIINISLLEYDYNVFIYLNYIIELRREEWCIKYLDIDNNVSDNALKES